MTLLGRPQTPRHILGRLKGRPVSTTAGEHNHISTHVVHSSDHFPDCNLAQIPAPSCSSLNLSAFLFGTPVSLPRVVNGLGRCHTVVLCVAWSLWGHTASPPFPRADQTECLLKFLSLGPQVFGKVTENWSFSLGISFRISMRNGLLEPGKCISCVSFVKCFLL